MIPDANKTCFSVKKRAQIRAIQQTLEFRRLVLAAQERGFVGSDLEELQMNVGESYDKGRAHESPFWYCLGEEDKEKIFQESNKNSSIGQWM